MSDGEEELRALLGEGDDVIVRVDQSGRILRLVTGAGYRGKGEPELAGHNVTEFLPSDDAMLVLRAIERAITLRETQIFDHRRPSPMGIRIVRARVVPSKAHGEAVAHLVDITEQVGTRTTLDETLERFRLVAQATTDVIFDFDPKANTTRWTGSIHKTFGFPADIVTDFGWWSERLHPDDRERVTTSVMAALADKSRHVWEGEYRFQANDGRWVDIFDRALIVRDAAGDAVRAVGSLLDVSEKKRLEKQLKLAERLSTLGTFAAGLAHEIKSPLTALTANLSIVTELVAGDDARRRLADVTAAAARIAGVVAGLDAFSEGGAQPSRVDARDVVEVALRLAQHDIERRASIELDMQEVPPVLAFKDQLVQVVLNLLANAHQALDEAVEPLPRIRIALSSDDDSVLVVVEDNGPGFLDAHASKLFEPFFTTKPSGKGTGLGLAICREIVNAHGGTIEASRASPHGARFSVRLPIAPREPSVPLGASDDAPCAPSAHEHRSGRRLEVLYVDDDTLTQRLAEHVLGATHDVVVAGDVATASELLRSRRFDVVISDVEMPRASGHALAAMTDQSGASFAFVTASEPPALPATKRARWLKKPFTPEELLRFVNDVGNESERKR